ncbi:ion channel [Synechococcus sp. CCY9201]|uniref:ion channel n=1 Tax=unclassified Synechococcus TaxID=2626047 RepID=UPI001E4180AF|nr:MULTISPECIES: ion channel [unclassified Synechococcus]MEA5472780.1 ion channel [Synechococcus sp. CCY9201]
MSQRRPQRRPEQREQARRLRGLLTITEAQSGFRHWREPYLLMLSVSWPLFLGLITTLYLLINLLFAALYRLDPAGIGGVSGGGAASFADAFFFSVQTLGSIGYGVLHPSSLTAHLIVTAEALTGLIFIALTTGLAFARFSRSSARIRFSSLAAVHPYNGVPTLTFRVANERRNTILGANLKAYLSIDERSSEGHRMRRLHPLRLSREDGIAFTLAWTAMHPINRDSPLWGLGPDQLAVDHAEVVVSFSGTDGILERPIHAHASYPVDCIAFGRCFVDMVETDGARAVIDFSRFHQTRACPMPDPGEERAEEG